MKDRKRDFMSGVALLTFSAACAKICGMLFKIPLVSVIGDAGMGYFNSAYVIYTFFYVLSTSGLPVGLSILVSESIDQRQRIGYLRCGLFLFGGLGFFLCAIMLLFPQKLAFVIGNPGAALSIRIMGPALPAVCLSGCLRGFYQGKKNMMPTAVSQVIEAFFKTAAGIALAFSAVAAGCDAKVSSAMGLAGVTLGSILSLIYLIVVYVRDAEKGQGDPDFASAKRHLFKTCKRMLAVVLPVSGASVVVSISSVIDLSVIMRGLVSHGADIDLANQLYGNYSGSAVPLFNLPSVLIAPIASAVIPFLAQREEGVQSKVLSGLSLRLATMVAAPCAVGLAVLSYPILSLLFGARSAQSAAPLLMTLAPAILFVGIQTVSGAILQGCGYRKIPVISLALGAVIKLLGCLLLVPRFGMMGAPLGTILCYFVSSGINLFCCIYKKAIQVHLVRDFILPSFAALICGTSAWGIYRLLPEGGFYTLCAIGAAIPIYLFVLILFGLLDLRMATFFPIIGKLPFLRGKNTSTDNSM